MSDRARRCSALGSISMAMLVIWTIVLPWIGAWPSVRGRIDFLDQQGIDPAALYYTDLKAMAEIEANIAILESTNPGIFWTLQIPSNQPKRQTKCLEQTR